MALKDLTRNGRPLNGPFSRPSVPIIGQSRSSLTWKQVGLVNIRPPAAASDLATSDPLYTPADPNYVITVGGMRTDGQMVVSAAPLTPAIVALGPQAIVEQVGLALNFLHTYMNCSCPTGTRCAAHTPPKTDAAPDPTPKSEADDMAAVKNALVLTDIN